MASIERTAYPRFPRTLTLKDLQASFTPKPEEIEWAQQHARTADRRLAILVLLKCFEFLRHFPALDAIPAEVVEHVSATLGMAPTDKIEFASLATLYRHHKAIRELLGVRPYTDGQTRTQAIQIAQQAAGIVETRVDIINITIEELVRLGYELPAFRTLDEISEQAHSAAEASLHKRITQRLTSAQSSWLDRLLTSELPARRSLYNQIKKSARKASRKHLDLLLDQLVWLESLPDSDALLDGVPVTKLNYMAGMASALDAGDMKDFGSTDHKAQWPDSVVQVGMLERQVHGQKAEPCTDGHGRCPHQDHGEQAGRRHHPRVQGVSALAIEPVQAFRAVVDRVEPPEPGDAVAQPMNAIEAEIENHTDGESLRPQRPLSRPQ